MSNTELILNADGSVYHLHLQPGDIADKIILVGDPMRVDLVARRLDRVEWKKEKREFRTVTGWFEGERVTIISTGIGTDNVDIVLNELDALVNIDFSSREPKEHLRSLQIIRLGTCGGLQPALAPGTLVLSHAAVGLDALFPFYVTHGTGISALEAAARQALAAAPRIASLVYASRADASLSALVASSRSYIERGITFTAPGFYGPQGRGLGRVPVTMTGLPDVMATVSADGFRTLNMEMETSGLLFLGEALGHRCGSLSVILANRPRGIFHSDPAVAVEVLIEEGLALLKSWR